ncbi:MAG: MarR family winged helix-turn-helix transcriptional regulator [Rhodococcus sp. (in: high G+C Gram-positive bacteria)]|uniref:MarR family winged helix-turn-helix transcriptional regulator n=1 Tax=Rhodococcus sp. TaxID=1831 RepID=UPI002AD96EAE|nr:MarR family winged helix-turn-helix transcriptional regulator [Rhodococcus sp. (in: high G+C Gram-positive bacteria)]
MTNQPMQPPANQPIGFWTARAGEAIRARTRGALEAIGVTQPQWWALHQLSLHPEGMERAVLLRTIGPNESTDVIDAAVDSALDLGWAREEESVLLPTDAGSQQFDRAARVQQMLQEERMQGISEEEFVTTITVLQRTITNVGGDAWHW